MRGPLCSKFRVQEKSLIGLPWGPSPPWLGMDRSPPFTILSKLFPAGNSPRGKPSADRSEQSNQHVPTMATQRHLRLSEEKLRLSLVGKLSPCLRTVSASPGWSREQVLLSAGRHSLVTVQRWKRGTWTGHDHSRAAAGGTQSACVPSARTGPRLRLHVGAGGSREGPASRHEAEDSPHCQAPLLSLGAAALAALAPAVVFRGSITRSHRRAA